MENINGEIEQICGKLLIKVTYNEEELGMKIKECPFCGGRAKVYKQIFDYGDPVYQVICTECFSQSAFQWEKYRAIQMWNRRRENGETGGA